MTTFATRDYRQDFADFSPVTFLDVACQGPFPRVTAERLREAINLKTRPDRLKAPEYFSLPQRVRERIARLIGAEEDEIAITNSAMQGIGIAVSGLPLGAGDEVVVSSSNFPSNLFSWLQLRRKGVTVKVIDPRNGLLGPEQVAAELSPRTRVLALDWVDYATGVRIDLAAFGALIHARGGIFVVDGTQAVGAIDLDLHAVPVDLMACAAYKWLLGPYGTGFAYIAKRLLSQLDVSVINWYAVEGADEFDSLPAADFRLVRGARVFDCGETGNFINVHGLDASLEYLQSATVTAVYRHCRHLLQRLEQGLRAHGYELSAAALTGHESTIVCFRAATPQATTALHRKLGDNHVAVSLRQGMIRVSPYLYNEQADIDRLLELARPA